MKSKNGLMIIDYPDKRVIFSEWTKHQYIFLRKDIENNRILEYTIGVKNEVIRADGSIVARGIISIT